VLASPDGFQAAFAAAAGIAAFGAVLAVVLFRPRVPAASTAGPAPGAEQLDGRPGQ
jgi:hypothetical protein